MNEYFNCKFCEKSNKFKPKGKHLNSREHKNSSDSIISRYILENPNFLKIDNTLKTYVLDYNKNLNIIQLYVNGFYTCLTISSVLKQI